MQTRRNRSSPAVHSQPYYLIPTLMQGCLLAASFMPFRIIYIPFSGVPLGRNSYGNAHDSTKTYLRYWACMIFHFRLKRGVRTPLQSSTTKQIGLRRV